MRVGLEWKRSLLAALLAAIPLVAFVYWWEFPRYKAAEERRGLQTLIKGKMLSLAAAQYAADNGGRLPPAATWEQALAPYLVGENHPFSIAGPDGSPPRRFALNRRLAGRSTADLKAPADAVLFFESTAKTPDASDELATLPRYGKDPGDSVTIMSADGHGYAYPREWELRLGTSSFRQEVTGLFETPSRHRAGPRRYLAAGG